MLFSLSTKSNTEIFLSVNPRLSTRDWFWLISSVMVSAPENPSSKEKQNLISTKPQCHLPLDVSTKTILTHSNIYLSILFRAGWGSCAPSSNNSKRQRCRVTSQVLAQVASLLDNDFVAEAGKISYFYTV